MKKRRFIRIGKWFLAIGNHFIVLKGVTCYEFQIWRFGVRWCYLTGGSGYYGSIINPFRRLSFQYFDPKIYNT